MRAAEVALARLSVRAVCAVLLPAVATALALRFLVPRAGSGALGVVAAIGHGSPLLFAGALFLVLSAVGHYWLLRLSSTPRTPTTARPARTVPRELGSVALVVGAAAGAALLFRAFVARPYRVEGPSMLPTLEPGDLVAGAGGRVQPRRGDIVVFAADVAPRRTGLPAERHLVKRVIGLPGDRIGMRAGAPTINGWAVPTCDAGDYFYLTSDGEEAVHGRLRVEFLADRTYLTVSAFGRPFVDTYVVQPGEVFVLGDDRGNSRDSRDYGAGHGGGVPLPAVEATVDRFLLGTHRSGDPDLGRALGAMDTLEVHLRLEGVETRPLEEGIARCLAGRPAVTAPPPPGGPP